MDIIEPLGLAFSQQDFFQTDNGKALGADP